MKSLNWCLALMFIAFGSNLVLGQNSEINEAKERMKERVKAVDSLKESGKAGENNKGYLEAREDLSKREKALIEAENEDRKILYKAVAKSTNQSIEEVGQQRALRIAKISKSGVWLENARGKWYRK